MSLVDQSPFKCQECYNHEKLCELHNKFQNDETFEKRQFPFPNYLVTLREHEYHGCFIREDYGSPLLEGCSNEGDIIKVPYRSYGTTKTPVSNELKPGRYGKQSKDWGIESVAIKHPKNPLETFLKTTVTNPSYKNTTIIGSGDFLCHVYKSLKDLDVGFYKPHRDKNGHMIRIVTQLNGITILSLDSFIGKKSEELQNLNGPFFPWSFNHEMNYLYSGEIPNCNLFLEPGDPVKLANLKKTWVDNFNQTWNFKEELQSVLFNQAIKLLECALEIQNFSHDLQHHLKSILKKENMPIFNIFKNSSNLPVFGFILMQHYALADFNIFAVKNPTSGVSTFRTSKPEYCYQYYVQKKRKGHKLFASYLSNEGPKKFKNIPVDIYDFDRKEVQFTITLPCKLQLTFMAF